METKSQKQKKMESKSKEANIIIILSKQPTFGGDYKMGYGRSKTPILSFSNLLREKSPLLFHIFCVLFLPFDFLLLLLLRFFSVDFSSSEEIDKGLNI